MNLNTTTISNNLHANPCKHISIVNFRKFPENHTIIFKSGQVAMNAFEYLATELTEASVDRLFHDAWACQAVFQSLPALSQQIVMRLLFCDAAMPTDQVLAWATDSAVDVMQNALDKVELYMFGVLMMVPLVDPFTCASVD